MGQMTPKAEGPLEATLCKAQAIHKKIFNLLILLTINGKLAGSLMSINPTLHACT